MDQKTKFLFGFKKYSKLKKDIRQKREKKPAKFGKLFGKILETQINILYDVIDVLLRSNFFIFKYEEYVLEIFMNNIAGENSLK